MTCHRCPDTHDVATPDGLLWCWACIAAVWVAELLQRPKEAA